MIFEPGATSPFAVVVVPFVVIVGVMAALNWWENRKHRRHNDDGWICKQTEDGWSCWKKRKR